MFDIEMEPRRNRKAESKSLSALTLFRRHCVWIWVLLEMLLCAVKPVWGKVVRLAMSSFYALYGIIHTGQLPRFPVDIAFFPVVLNRRVRLEGRRRQKKRMIDIL